jgi:hypothetical protein
MAASAPKAAARRDFGKNAPILNIDVPCFDRPRAVLARR